MPRDASEPPFFVVGCGRSGSTMLRLMLDAHPDLAVPGESHFIPPLWRARRRYTRGGRLDAMALAGDVSRTPHFGHWKIPAESYLDRARGLPDDAGFADVIEAAFLANAEHHGKRRWADKTPIYVRQIPLLASLWPRARFVHLIRDGRDVALSYLSIPWGPNRLSEAAWKWRRDVSAGRRDGPPLGPERYLEIRYEDLVTERSATLERICEFVSLPFVPSMLEHHREVDRARLAPTTGLPFHSRAARPVEERARDWRTQMTPRQVTAFEAIAGGLLAELGYGSETHPGPTARAGAAIRSAGYRSLEAASDAKKAVSRLAGRPPANVGRAQAYRDRRAG